MIVGRKEQVTYFTESVIGLSESVINLTQTVITYVAGEHPIQQTLIRIYAQQRHCCNNSSLQEFLNHLPVSNNSINKCIRCVSFQSFGLYNLPPEMTLQTKRFL